VNTARNDHGKGGGEILKSKCIEDYSRKISAVDQNVMQFSSIQCVCKFMEWYQKKWALHILDVALFNVQALCLMLNEKRCFLQIFK
jgi:hypothetical protein